MTTYFNIDKVFGISVKSFLPVCFLTFLPLFTSCNSNDDAGVATIEIPGVTFDGDVDCCSAEEALQVYKFIQTVKIQPELSTVIDEQYNVFAYIKGGEFHTGYNEVYFVATKKKNGNYVKDFVIDGVNPTMLMTKMNMLHSTPAAATAISFNDNYPAVRRTWVSFVMPTSDAGSWTLSYNVKILGSEGGITEKAITVNDLPAGQEWVKSFKIGSDTYYLSLVNPGNWKTGSNTIQAYVSKKGSEATKAYPLATEKFTIDIDPRMPDMGNHTSPNNTPLTLQSDGSYQGTINLTMTGLWRIHLTVKNAQGEVIAGGDDLKDGFSSLFWDVTL